MDRSCFRAKFQIPLFLLVILRGCANAAIIILPGLFKVIAN